MVLKKVGDTMSFTILISDTNKVIHIPSVRTAKVNDRNYHANMGWKNHTSVDVYDKDMTEPDSKNGEVIIKNDPPPMGHKHNRTYDGL